MTRPRLPRKVEGLLEAMRRADSGDEQPINTWMATRYASLVGACERWAGDAELGERIAHRVVCAAYKRCRRGQGRGSELAWISRATELELLEVLRPGRYSECEPPDSLHDDTADPVAEAVRAEQCDAVRAAIQALPLKYRGAMYLRYILEAREAEVAAWMRDWVGVGSRQTHKMLGEGREMVQAVLQGKDPRRIWPLRYREIRRNSSSPPRFDAVWGEGPTQGPGRYTTTQRKTQCSPL